MKSRCLGEGQLSRHFSYLFEAKGIQKYIFDTGRLADLVGASSLVSDLCNADKNDLLEEVLVAAGVEDVEFSRRAGAAFCVHSNDRDALLRLRALWRLAVSVMAPGLTFTDTDPVEGNGKMGAMKAAYRAQSGIRENTAAFLLPTGGPMTEFNPRSGRVAVRREKVGSNFLLLDQVTEVQRDQTLTLNNSIDEDRLAEKFLPKGDEAKDYVFPRHFEYRDATAVNPAFPFGASSGETPRDKRIAVIHADVSGLGRIFRDAQVKAQNPEELRELAEAIETAIEDAAREASEETILLHSATKGDHGFNRLFGQMGRDNPPDKKVVPARPVLLGGDDITIITRADLAIRFTRVLLKKIEAKTTELTTGRLTACAGVAVVSSGHPFLAAHNMAESMCNEAKRAAKSGREGDYPSYLAFSIVTSSIDEDYAEDYEPREKRTVGDKPMNVAAYLVSDPLSGKLKTGERLENLMALADLLDRTEGYGKLLEWLSQYQQEDPTADATWDRFWEVLDPDSRNELRNALNKCVALPDAVQPQAVEKFAPILNDALELVDIGTVFSAGDAK